MDDSIKTTVTWYYTKGVTCNNSIFMWCKGRGPRQHLASKQKLWKHKSQFEQPVANSFEFSCWKCKRHRWEHFHCGPPYEIFVWATPRLRGTT